MSAAPRDEPQGSVSLDAALKFAAPSKPLEDMLGGAAPVWPAAPRDGTPKPLLVLNLEPDYVQQVVTRRDGPALVEFEIDPDYMADLPTGFIVFEGQVLEVSTLSAKTIAEKGIPAFTDTWYEGPWRKATAADLEAWGLLAPSAPVAPAETTRDAKTTHLAAVAAVAQAGIALGRAEIDHHLGEISQAQWEAMAKAYQEADAAVGRTLDDLLAAPDAPASGQLDRDTLGRVVRDAWIRWAQTQPSPKPSWLVPYDALAEADKEADRQIGEAVAVFVRAPASGEPTNVLDELKDLAHRPSYGIEPRDSFDEVISRVNQLIARLEAGGMSAAPVGRDEAGWQPIATAPRDGTVIDVWLGDADEDEVAFYCTEGTRRSEGWKWRNRRFRPLSGFHTLETQAKPTHWMPLPPAPSLLPARPESGDTKLRRSLRWALDYIRDGLNDSRNPAHACEYATNPEKGACDFCDAWADAYEALGSEASDA